MSNFGSVQARRRSKPKPVDRVAATCRPPARLYSARRTRRGYSRSGPLCPQRRTTAGLGSLVAAAVAIGADLDGHRLRRAPLGVHTAARGRGRDLLRPARGRGRHRPARAAALAAAHGALAAAPAAAPRRRGLHLPARRGDRGRRLAAPLPLVPGDADGRCARAPGRAQRLPGAGRPDRRPHLLRQAPLAAARGAAPGRLPAARARRGALAAHGAADGGGLRPRLPGAGARRRLFRDERAHPGAQPPARPSSRSAKSSRMWRGGARGRRRSRSPAPPFPATCGRETCARPRTGCSPPRSARARSACST